MSNFLLVAGLPGCSEYPKDKLKDYLVFHCPDKAEPTQREYLYRTLKEHLSVGENVAVISYMTQYKQRMDMIQHFHKIKDCKKTCVWMATDKNLCFRHAGDWEYAEREYKRVWIPGRYEGWDDIQLFFDPDGPLEQKKSQSFLFGILKDVPHDNPHHRLSIGEHCLAAYGCVDPLSPEVEEAAKLHDIGKFWTKEFIDSYGNRSKTAHYYAHEHVGAYESLWYTSPGLDKVYVANLIQWHMKPFEIKAAGGAENLWRKFKNLVGDTMFDEIMAIHAADLKAH